MSDPKDNPLVKESMALLQRLLSPARTRIALVNGRPLATAKQAGALAVVGMKTEAPKTWVTVFIYKSWGEATGALQTVKQIVPDRPDLCTVSAVCGRMVLYGQGTSKGPEASFTRYVLNNIRDAFDED